MFYELKHLVGVNYFLVIRDNVFSFQPHMHGCFEMITATAGSIDVTVDDRTYTLTPGLAVLVFPHQIHSFQTSADGLHQICIFSPQLVSAYAKSVIDKHPVSNCFEIPQTCIDQIYALSQDDNISIIKGALYTLCGIFDQQADYTDTPESDNYRLLYTIFSFVHEHYQEDCSLENLSRTLNYSYTYLSKFFNQKVGISFSAYVNNFRISEVCCRLDDTDDSILKISTDCGFASLRTMNRNFHALTGMTPGEYRRRKQTGELRES